MKHGSKLLYTALLCLFSLPLFMQVNDSLVLNDDGLDASYRLELEIALQDGNIDDYYKGIFNEGRLIENASELKMLALADSLLFTSNQNWDLFYFVAFTKSMNGSDGFYSEAVSMSSFKFITSNTLSFSKYFESGVRLGEKDLNNWARFVLGEIIISREKQEFKAIEELSVLLLTNVKGNKNEYTLIVEKLIKQMTRELEKLGIKQR